MSTRVDTDGLRAAGRGLTQTAAVSVGDAPHCAAAAADPVSVSAAEALSRRSAYLWSLVEHAAGLRESGGTSLVETAGLVDDVDVANARMIAGLSDGRTVAAPNIPELMTAPPDAAPSDDGSAGIAAPLRMSAEDIAAQVHAGPGTGHLRAFAEHWRATVAPLLLQTADDTRGYGRAVQAHWQDGRQRAADNVAEHAEWLESSLHHSALALADAADRVADHTDVVIGNTPRPEELRDLKRRYNAALAAYRSSGGLDAAPAVALGTQWTQTSDATLAGYETFAAAAPVGSNHPWRPPNSAPPIVRNSDSAAAPTATPRESPPRPRGADDGRHGGEHRGDGGGEDMEEADTPAPASPGGPGGPPPTATTPSAADTTKTGTVANIAGTLTGAGFGAVGQITNVLHGLTGASPMSALSSLSAPPGPGSGRWPTGTPGASGDGGGSDPLPDVPADGDFGTGGTAPASDGIGGGGGAPLSNPTPTVSGASVSGPSVGAPSIAAQNLSGTSGFGGGGMYAPPMMGGLGRGDDDATKSDDKRRVVHRPVPNGEPVFGEVERKRSSRRSDKQEEVS